MTKPQHGGRRNPPGGRPRLTEERTVKKTITLTPADLDYLKGLDANLSQAVRLLIARSREGR